MPLRVYRWRADRAESVSHNAPLTPANRATRHHWPSRCDPDERCAERAHTDYRLDNLLFPASVVADTPIAVVESQSACGTGVRDPCRVADVFQMLIPNLGLLRVRRMPTPSA